MAGEVTTSVFKSGNSQAVRIPKEFKLDVDRVEIRRIGGNLVIIPSALTAMDAIELVTYDLPDGWADNLERPVDGEPSPLPEWGTGHVSAGH